MELEDCITTLMSIQCYTCGFEKSVGDVSEYFFLQECEREGWKANNSGARCPFCVNEKIDEK